MTKDGKKKFLWLLVCAVLILSCCSCSSRKSAQEPAQSTASAQEGTGETAQETTEGVSQAPAGDAAREEEQEVVFEDALIPEVKLPEAEWLDQVMFPGYGEFSGDGSARDMAYTFSGGQGPVALHIRCSSKTESFRLTFNGHSIDTAPIFRNPSNVFGPGGMIDLSPWTVDGENTIRVSDIQPGDLAEAVEIYIHCPESTEEAQDPE